MLHAFAEVSSLLHGSPLSAGQDLCLEATESVMSQFAEAHVGSRGGGVACPNAHGLFADFSRLDACTAETGHQTPTKTILA